MMIFITSDSSEKPNSWLEDTCCDGKDTSWEA